LSVSFLLARPDRGSKIREVLQNFLLLRRCFERKQFLESALRRLVWTIGIAVLRPRKDDHLSRTGRKVVGEVDRDFTVGLLWDGDPKLVGMHVEILISSQFQRILPLNSSHVSLSMPARTPV
jgi:hypothetical protein